jgi:hypothetical protein
MSTTSFRSCLPPLTFIAVSFLFLSFSNAFYLPGVAPTVFKDDQEVTAYVSSVISPESTLQFDFYTVPFCRPSEVTDLAESLGEALVGDKAQTSAYKFQVNRNVNCAVLCRKQYSHAEMSRLADFALLNYRANMRLDNLPLAEMADVVNEGSDDVDTEYFLGFPVALNSEEDEASAQLHEAQGDKHATYYLANHLHFRIKIHPVTKSVVKGRHADGSLIVGFQVIPMSVKHTYDGVWSEGKGGKDKDKGKDGKDKAPKNIEITSCDDKGIKFPHTQLALPSSQDIKDSADTEDTTEVIWTYDVAWEESDVEWASRWDVFLNMKGDKIRWVSIFNSLGVLLLLTGIVAALMLRILRKDLAAYNAVPSDEEAADIQEETGWKLVYADVFRAPTFARAYAVLHGAGAQFFLLVSLTLAFAALGFLSPSNRGSLLTAIVVFFALSGNRPALQRFLSLSVFLTFDPQASSRVTWPLVCAKSSRRVRSFRSRWLLPWPFPACSSWCSSSSTQYCGLAKAAELYHSARYLRSYRCGALFPRPSFSLAHSSASSVKCKSIPAAPTPSPVRCLSTPRPSAQSVHSLLLPQIPPQSLLLSTPVCCIVAGVFVFLVTFRHALASVNHPAGVLPFGAVFVELFFIVSSIWQHKFYYMFGFLLLVFLIFCITCAEVSVVST